jgi:hypothetical protein
MVRSSDGSLPILSGQTTVQSVIFSRSGRGRKGKHRKALSECSGVSVGSPRRGDGSRWQEVVLVGLSFHELFRRFAVMKSACERENTRVRYLRARHKTEHLDHHRPFRYGTVKRKPRSREVHVQAAGPYSEVKESLINFTVMPNNADLSIDVLEAGCSRGQC